MKYSYRLAALLFLVPVLHLAPVACATATPAIVGSGQSLVVLGKTFEGTGAGMYQLCSTGNTLVNAQVCADWAVFASDFKKAYAVSAAAWDVAAANTDGGALVVPDLTALAQQLAGFTAFLVSTLSLDGGL